MSEKKLQEPKQLEEKKVEMPKFTVTQYNGSEICGKRYHAGNSSGNEQLYYLIAKEMRKYAIIWTRKL